jgi:uncharacterized membrane protein YoaK (UPF0700 family)
MQFGSHDLGSGKLGQGEAGAGGIAARGRRPDGATQRGGGGVSVAVPIRLLASSALWRVVLLCSVAGFVDAFGYLQFGHVFAANMTGNSVLLSIAAAEGDWHRVGLYAATLAAFVAGALVAGLLKHALQRPHIAILIAAALLVLVHLVAGDAAIGLMLLGAAMGLQGAALSRFGTVTLTTVVITGVILRLADGLIARLWARRRTGEAAAANEETSFTAVAWLSYTVGGAAGVGGIAVTDQALLVPALLLAGLGISMALASARAD